MSTEPVLSIITAVVVASIVLLVAFGVHVTDEQKTAIVAFVVALYGAAALIRSKVTPTARVIPAREVQR